MSETITPFEELVSKSGSSMKHRMELTVAYFQGKICKRIEELEDKKKFKVDRWLRKEGGGGLTCILQDGELDYVQTMLCASVRAKESPVAHKCVYGRSLLHPAWPMKNIPEKNYEIIDVRVRNVDILIVLHQDVYFLCV